MRIALCLAVLVAAGTALGAEPKAKPNVVVIVADELGPRDLGCTGSTYYKTPNLDAFAKQGVKQDEAYVGTFPEWVPFATTSSNKLIEAPSMLAPFVGQFGFEPNGYHTFAQIGRAHV